MTQALVLGGGGPVGIAWESGVVAGLEREGVSLRSAALIVGTSAGSVVGAQLALGRTADELMTRREVIPAPASEAASEQPAQAPARPGGSGLEPIGHILAQRKPGDPPEKTRAQIGEFARGASALDESLFVGAIGQMIVRGAGEPAWPDRFVCTAVDTHDGAFVSWNADADVELDRALASSCAVPGIFPPITIRGRRYMDGGIRSTTNADLAIDHTRVVILAVSAGPLALFVKRPLEREVEALRKAGAQVEVIVPDEECLRRIGTNLMDPQLGPAVAEAGEKQGHAEAERIKGLWGASA